MDVVPKGCNDNIEGFETEGCWEVRLSPNYILGQGGVGVDLVWIDFTDICGNSDLNGLLNLMKVK